MKKITSILISSFLATSMVGLQAATRNWTAWKQNDFASGYLEPFQEDQGNTGSDVLDEGFGFYTVSGDRLCQITWRESEYDGSRAERGHEIKGQVTSDDTVFSGWNWRFPNNGGNQLISNSEETIIWQMYCWNSAGCSNWTAHMTLWGNDLYCDYRAACVSSTRKLVKANFVKNRWYGMAVAIFPGNGNGKITIQVDDSVELNEKNISVGFGDKNSDGSMKDAVIGVKMGIYAADTSGYSNNETRRLWIDDLSVADTDGGASVNTCWNRVEPW
ncbi:MAG: hypothetical protein ACSHYA_02410 [Opitutaceae bacterium]